MNVEAFDRVKYDDQGLATAVVQQFDTREVLMVGWMDAEALRRTLTTGRVTFWSRSRQEYWRKGDTSGHIQIVKGARLDCDGDTSGHIQIVKGARLDCDGDTLLLEVDQVGAACHTGDHTCFDATDLEPVVGQL